jgi:hypothetical protein
MLEAPKQDWKLYAAKWHEDHVEWLRRLTPAAALSLLESMRRFANAHSAVSSTRERMEAARWEEKLAIRRKLLAAFKALDERRE